MPYLLLSDGSRLLLGDGVGALLLESSDLQFTVEAVDAFVPGLVESDAFAAGLVTADDFCPGLVQAESHVGEQ